jgi:WD40 repeat protein
MGDQGVIRMYELPEDDGGKAPYYGKLAYNGDGSKIACCGADAIVVWSTGDCSQPASSVPIDRGTTITALSLDCDCDQMAALLTSKDEIAVVKYWKIDTGGEIESLQIPTDKIWRAVFAKKNAMLVTSHTDKICVWNLEEDRATLETAINGDFNAIDVTRSGDVTVGCDDYAVRIYDAHSGAKLAVYRGHNGVIRSLRFSPQGDRLVSTSFGESTRIWDTTKEALSANPPSATDGRWFTKIRFSPNGKHIAAIAWRDPRVIVWDGETGMFVTALVGHAESVAAFAFSANNSVLASVSKDGVVILWDIRQEAMHSRSLSQSKSTESLKPVDMTFSADSDLLAIVYSDEESFVVKIYDVSAGVESFQSEPNHGHPPHLIRFSPGEPLIPLRRIAPGRQVRIWDYATATVEEHAYDDNVHSNWVFPFYIKSYEWVVSSSTERRLFWLPDYRRPYNSDGLDVHGNRLAIGSMDGTLTLLDMSRLQDMQL